VSSFGATRGGLRLGRSASFSTFGQALHLMFQVLLAGADWHLLMHDCMVQPPYCTQTFEGFSFGDCGLPAVAPVFFFALRRFCESLLWNLFVALALDHVTFFADDAAHVETADWRSGASLRQVSCFSLLSFPPSSPSLPPPLSLSSPPPFLSLVLRRTSPPSSSLVVSLPSSSSCIPLPC